MCYRDLPPGEVAESLASHGAAINFLCSLALYSSNIFMPLYAEAYVFEAEGALPGVLSVWAVFMAAAGLDTGTERAGRSSGAAGCTRQTIIALEQGKSLPSVTLAFQIARAFGVPVEEVFQYEEK